MQSKAAMATNVWQVIVAGAAGFCLALALPIMFVLYAVIKFRVGLSPDCDRLHPTFHLVICSHLFHTFSHTRQSPFGFAHSTELLLPDEVLALDVYASLTSLASCAFLRSPV